MEERHEQQAEPTPATERRRWKRYAVGAGAAFCLLLLLVHGILVMRWVPRPLLALIPLRPIDLARPNEVEVVDRRGELLRHLPADDGTRSRPVAYDEIPEVVVQAFLAAEDKRFFEHPGYDVLAIGRAVRDNLRRGWGTTSMGWGFRRGCTSGATCRG